MKWDLCSSPPCIPFYPYTMFHNPMPKPFCQKFRETLITQKVLVTQSSNILHCNWHIQKPICADFQAFSNTFSMFKLTFFFSFFVKGSSVNNQKVHILLILTGKNASKWLQWCIFRVQGVPIPMAQVSSLYNKWFLKNHKFRQKFHILLILTGINASKWLEWHIFRVWCVPNPMVQVSSLYNKWFLKNQKFRQKFHILLILTGKSALKWLGWCILGFKACQIQWHLFQLSMMCGSWKSKYPETNSIKWG